jgi:hypothetical protein
VAKITGEKGKSGFTDLYILVYTSPVSPKLITVKPLILEAISLPRPLVPEVQMRL